MRKARLRFVFLVLTASLLGGLLFSFSAAAATVETAVTIEALNERAKTLAAQMQLLQSRLEQLKQQQATLNRQKNTAQQPPSVSSKASNEVPVATLFDARTKRQRERHQGEQPIRGNPAGTPGSQKVSDKRIRDWLKIGDTSVVTTPYFGPQPQFNGSDTLVTFSEINKDLFFLRIRQQMDKLLAKASAPVQDYSAIILSGQLGSTATLVRSYTRSQSSDLNLTDAELDVAALIYPWMLGYATFTYDGMPPPGVPSVVNGGGGRLNDSNVILDQGFVTVGNLDRAPFYISLGQLYVPFGQYTTYMNSQPLTELIGRAKLRTALLGYDSPGKRGLYAAVYAFSSDTRAGNNRNIDAGGGNIGYHYELPDFKGSGSISVISNIANAIRIQDNGVDGEGQFSGFGAAAKTMRLAHTVPGFDARADLSYHAFTLLGEYTGAIGAFAAQDMDFNGHGASPKAVHVEGVYSYALFNRPGSYAVGYDRSWDALALNLPRNRFITTLTYSVRHSTLLTLEYRHDINYGATDTAGGAIADPIQMQVPLRPAGATENTVTLVANYFF
jgi:hypothetical protein